MSLGPKRVVLDCNQIVGAGSAFLVKEIKVPDMNACRRILIHVADHHQGLYCAAILGEYVEKLVELGHPKDRIVLMMAYIMGAFEQITVVTKVAPNRPVDPDDEVFILCALDGQADYLVSDDHHLLNLQSSYQRPMIHDSKEFLAIIGA